MQYAARDESQEGQTSFELGYRPCLDGLRAIAVFSVILFHIPSLPIIGGFIGVDLFFVLSGFLITTLLYQEHARAGRISLRSFYARRAIRLLPALFLVLGTVLVLSQSLESPEARESALKGVLYALSYLTNWLAASRGGNHVALGHTWSLAIEEQFYLLWPLFFMGMLRWGWTRKRIFLGILFIIGASALLRGYYWHTDQNMLRAYSHSETRADGLLIGALAGLLVSWGWAPRTRFQMGLMNLMMALACTYYASSIFSLNVSMPGLYYGGMLLENVSFALLIVGLVTCASGATLKAFEFPPLVWLGRISYGLYLWHMPSYWIAGLLGWGPASRHWIVSVPATLGLATLSFYGIEQPLSRFLKGKFVSTSSLPGV